MNEVLGEECWWTAFANNVGAGLVWCWAGFIESLQQWGSEFGRWVWCRSVGPLRMRQSSTTIKHEPLLSAPACIIDEQLAGALSSACSASELAGPVAGSVAQCRLVQRCHCADTDTRCTSRLFVNPCVLLHIRATLCIGGLWLWVLYTWHLVNTSFVHCRSFLLHACAETVKTCVCYSCHIKSKVSRVL